MHPVPPHLLAAFAPAPRRLRWLRGRRYAAVAACFRDVGSGPELMVIRRAEREGDRWSGDICFPGGLAHPQDTDPLHTAVRETHEETNLVLGAPLGALDDVLAIRPHGLRPMVIVPHVFWVTTQRPVPDGREVQTCHWLPLDALLDPSHRDRMVRRIGPIPARFDRIRFQGLTVWGLTLTMIDNLVARIRP